MAGVCNGFALYTQFTGHDMRLSGKVGVITGCSLGIGRAGAGRWISAVTWPMKPLHAALWI